MIAANKRFLKANLTQVCGLCGTPTFAVLLVVVAIIHALIIIQGVLGIQTNLITLYSNNLSAVATQAALIGGFSFSAVSALSNTSTIKQLTLSYFYYVCFTVCLVAALFVLSQATIVVMFGPTMALKGSTDEAVKVAAGHMMSQQFFIFQVAAISITALFLGACILSWANYPVGIATITTVIYLVGYYYVIVHGHQAYSTFVTGEAGAFLEPENGDNSNSQGGYKSVAGESGDLEQGNTNSAVLAVAQENVRTKLKAILWKRQSIEEGGLFVKYFAVLEKGRLDFYAKEKDYRENANPVNLKPVKLWQFDLETDHRKYSKNAVSLAGVMKSAMMGNEDFSMSDAMTSEFDLQYASKNFKFGLVPKVSSELNAAVIYELLAHDEKSYKQWTAALSTVVRSYDLIAAMPSIEHTIRQGTADVETVVQAANNNV